MKVYIVIREWCDNYEYCKWIHKIYLKRAAADHEAAVLTEKNENVDLEWHVEEHEVEG